VHFFVNSLVVIQSSIEKLSICKKYEIIDFSEEITDPEIIPMQRSEYNIARIYICN